MGKQWNCEGKKEQLKGKGQKRAAETVRRDSRVPKPSNREPSERSAEDQVIERVRVTSNYTV